MDNCNSELIRTNKKVLDLLVLLVQWEGSRERYELHQVGSSLWAFGLSLWICLLDLMENRRNG